MQEQKDKISQSLKGKVFTEEHKQNIRVSAKKRGMEVAHKALAMKRLLKKQHRLETV